MTSNKGAAYQFRNEVLLALHAAGYPSAHAATETRGGEPKPVRGDILGLPLTIATRNVVNADWSSAMDEVTSEATAEGNDLFVSIQARRGRPLEDAYVSMPFAVFLKFLSLLCSSQANAEGLRLSEMIRRG